MHKCVFVLVCALSVCGALVCPDGGTCEDGETCCQTPSGGYGCCPLPNAECCSDHLHCCFEGTLCDLVHAKCVNKTHTLDWVKRVSAKPASLPQAVVCPDQESECPDDTTCCQMPDGSWGCCPLPNAVCCDDKKHCCPQGTTCDLPHSRCVSSTLASTPLMSKIPANRRVLGANRAVNSVRCNDSVVCESSATCCKKEDGTWACCPLPEAVCCEDHQHCCPHGTACNVAAGTCDSADAAVPWVKKSPTFALKTENERCDETSACPVGTTCCRQKSGAWACCPLPTAVCCDDHEHCCPQGYKCDVTHQSCDHPSRPRVPWLTKQPALTSTRSSEPTQKHQCDEQTSCPRGSTCCFMSKVGKWGCCPLPQAVCCGDGDHCCPSGYTCDKDKPVCIKGRKQISWFKKQPALSGGTVGDVKCDDTTSCASGSTCCRLPTGEWGCCPLVRAVCCQDHEHCCPEGYTCDLKGGTCLKPTTTHTVALKLLHTPSGEEWVTCDATTRCSESQTCCKMEHNQWACCPLKQAVCCEDLKHCCPSGYTCDPDKGCTRGPALTWWDNSL